MGVISGINAAVRADPAGPDITVESTVREWRIRYWGEYRPIVATNTSGARTRDGGITDWRGWYRQYHHTPLPFPGDTFEFAGAVDSVSNGAKGQAICDQIEIIAAGEAGRQIETRVQFSQNNALTIGGLGFAISDSSDPVLATAVERKVSLDAVDFSQVRMWRLVISRRNRPYVHHSTGGRRQRTVGNLDAAWVFQCYTDDPSALPVRGATPILRFYVTATTFWQVAWGKVEVIQGLGADREGAENVGATIAGSFAAYIGTGKGNIVNPAGGTKW